MTQTSTGLVAGIRGGSSGNGLIGGTTNLVALALGIVQEDPSAFAAADSKSCDRPVRPPRRRRPFVVVFGTGAHSFPRSQNSFAGGRPVAGTFQGAPGHRWTGRNRSVWVDPASLCSGAGVPEHRNGRNRLAPARSGDSGRRLAGRCEVKGWLCPGQMRSAAFDSPSAVSEERGHRA